MKRRDPENQPRLMAWRFQAEGAPHLVELETAYDSAASLIWLDGALIGRMESLIVRREERFRFPIRGVSCEIRVTRNAVGRAAYALFVDGREVDREAAMAERLLRPSSPSGNEPLLRPASRVDDVSAAGLLRPSGSDEPEE